MVLGTQKDVETDVSIKELENEISVREIMSEKVIIMDVESNMSEVAQEMIKHNVGSMIITKDNNAVGIITERDVVRKIAEDGIKPVDISAGDMMSSPIITIRPSTNIIAAAGLMTRSGIRRLAIMEGGDIVGIVTDRDVLTVSPGLNTILVDLIEMNREQNIPRTPEQEKGVCEYCGNFAEDLVLVNGLMLCERCRDAEGYYE